MKGDQVKLSSMGEFRRSEKSGRIRGEPKKLIFRKKKKIIKRVVFKSKIY